MHDSRKCQPLDNTKKKKKSSVPKVSRELSCGFEALTTDLGNEKIYLTHNIAERKP